MHWLDQTVGKPFYAEYLLEAIGDYLDGEANREYLSFYGRQGSGSRWSLYERAEFDLGHKWADRPNANSSQLSNVLFSGSYSVSKAVRFGVSYDQSRQILTLDDRFTPEELFDNSLREGYRVTAYLGSAKTVRGNFSIGQRWKQGNPDRSLTYNANVYHSNVFNWNMLLGADYSGLLRRHFGGLSRRLAYPEVLSQRPRPRAHLRDLQHRAPGDARSPREPVDAPFRHPPARAAVLPARRARVGHGR